MNIYKENLERSKSFYESTFYSYLLENYPNYVDGIFAMCCSDPDACDKELYKELANKYNLIAKSNYLIEIIDGEKVKLSADVTCSRKQFVNLRKSNFLEWAKDYEHIRGSLDAHHIWPKHKAPTINTLRYAVYRDRIDCLLFDLKMYFEGKDTPMYKAYKNGTTPLWLSKFKDFPDFVNTMGFERFVDEEYNIYDISKYDGSFIDHYIILKELYPTMENYVRNILKVYK